MKPNLYALYAWFVFNAPRIRLVVFTVVVMLLIVASFAPNVVSLADNVPSGSGH